MGNSFSDNERVIEEKRKWEKNHEIEIIPSLRQRHLASVEQIGADLKICSITKYFARDIFAYQHWFITDGDWFIEFANFDKEFFGRLMIHQDGSEFRKNGYNLYFVHDTFRLTTDVKQRLVRVCGAINASICLRNSEHMARYIQAGSWVSMQMANQVGEIRSQFESLMPEDVRKLINILPDNLKEAPVVDGGKIYPEASTLIRFTKEVDSLIRDDVKSSNIVFLGPTGSGKSRIINLLFNQVVSDSRPTASSVTKNVKILQGLKQYSSRQRVTLNIVDTIGLCDSTFSKTDVYNWIKDRVKINFTTVEVVVIVCSGRIEKVQVDAMRQYLDWLQFKKYPHNFVFIYNKADDLTEPEKMENLLQMTELIGLPPIGSDPYFYLNDEGERRVFDLRFTTSFPPNADHATIEQDWQKLVDSVLSERPEKISLDESTCSIL